MSGSWEGGDSVVIDARGHRCPVPTLRLGRALARCVGGALVVLLADDPMARIDVPHFVAQGGHRLIETADVDGALRFAVRKSTSEAGEGRAPRPDRG